jgi:endonuclease/exonuclease/phosphatase (EEP) superfamily protein YafD
VPLRRGLALLARVVCVSVGLLTLAGALGSWHLFELTTHFRLQYLVLALGCVALFGAARTWRWVIVGVLCAAINAPGVIAWYVRPASAASPASPRAMRLLLSNVSHVNTRYSALVELVRAERPDVVVLQEVTAGWLPVLGELSEPYPHRQRTTRLGSRGMAVLSAFPLEEARVVHFAGSALPSIVVAVTLAGQRVSIVATHPATPVRRHWFHARNAQLDALGRFVRELTGPRIVIGDLNTSPWSPYYQRFVRKTGLIDARRGFGVLPTWPTPLAVAALMIPIDHCLVSSELSVLDVRTGPNVNSDHLPLIVDVAVGRAPAPTLAGRAP